MTPKKIPLRRCNGCGESKPKKELVRVVRAGDGTVSLDLTGKKPGRGAYVCPSAACLAKARKAGRIARALEVSIPEEIYDAMAAEIEKTRRRVNALEHVMIPAAQEKIKYISMKLDENERSTQIRLMKVKDMMLEEARQERIREDAEQGIIIG